MSRGILILTKLGILDRAWSQVDLLCSQFSWPIFVFALGPFLPMVVVFSALMGISMGKWPKSIKWPKFTFLGSKWFTKYLNGGFRGAFVLKSGLRILIWALQVPFLIPPKTPKMGHFGCFWLFWGYRKWHFGCQNQNSKTIFQYKCPP